MKSPQNTSIAFQLADACKGLYTCGQSFPQVMPEIMHPLPVNIFDSGRRQKAIEREEGRKVRATFAGGIFSFMAATEWRREREEEGRLAGWRSCIWSFLS